MNGKTIALDVVPTSTVNNLKAQISDMTGAGQRIDYCNGGNRSYYPLRVLYGGKELEDAKSLCDYNIRQESILYLVDRTAGG